MHFADQAFIAETTAKMLLEVKAVLFFQDRPFVFTSGWASPVYIDCRKLIFYPRIRAQLVDFAVTTLARDVGFEQFDVVAGGETAGIPYAAWLAERLGLPMQYVRKKPKGFGRNAQIEGADRGGREVPARAGEVVGRARRRLQFPSRVITLNVNGVRSAASKGVFRWLATQRPDVVCLQEMKCQEADLDAKLHGMKLYESC